MLCALRQVSSTFTLLTAKLKVPLRRPKLKVLHLNSYQTRTETARENRVVYPIVLLDKSLALDTKHNIFTAHAPNNRRPDGWRGDKFLHQTGFNAGIKTDADGVVSVANPYLVERD